MPSVFNVIDLPGLTPDTLGSYLAAIGLLSTTSRHWPQVRGCWRNGAFCLIAGPTKLVELEVFLRLVAERNEWSEYSKAWDSSQKADRGKLPVVTARWRSASAPEKLLPLFQAHIAVADKLRFNPLLGTGGNAGKRDFAKGWKKAIETLKMPPRAWLREALNDDLHAFLRGGVCHCLGDFNAGCWFSAANKIYNSGTKKAFREGQITPWEMALACEGLLFFSGSTTRQLGNQTRTAGSFPFITAGAGPKSEGEAGRVLSEVWLPIWDRPMTRAELLALFQRGRAELSGRGATTPAAFSAAIIQRGVDSGIVEFRRCVLMRTTSDNTFESQVATSVPVRRIVERDFAEATRVAVALRDALPADRKEGTRWKFVGLRGPLEQALIDLAAAETEEQGAEKSWALVDAMFTALAKVDRNRAQRARKMRFELMPSSLAARLFTMHPPSREARLALGPASLRSRSGTVAEFLAYRLGVTRLRPILVDAGNRASTKSLGWCQPG